MIIKQNKHILVMFMGHLMCLDCLSIKFLNFKAHHSRKLEDS
jgi:hypothetical protein